MRKTFLLLAVLAAAGAVCAQDTVSRQAVRFQSGRYTLSGELLLPQRTHRVGAVVFLVGSGAESSSYRTTYQMMLREAFEKELLPAGIALLYFDKRGVGASEGAWHKTDYYERADDARAAIEFLRSQPEIDPRRIGVAGHSQGGWIAQIVAARYPEEVAFMVSLAGPTFSVRRQIINDVEARLRCGGMEETKAHRRAKLQVSAMLAATSVAPVQPDWKFLKSIRSFSPAREIKALQCPSLFLFAENDALVYPHWAIEEMHQLFGGNIPAHIEYKTIAGANHGFHLAELCYRGRWRERPISEEFIITLREWVVRQVNSQ